MAYVSWAVGVNKAILDSAEITLGDKATIDDSLESGKTRSRLAQTHSNKAYSVVMDFSYMEGFLHDGSKDPYYEIDGLTEYHRFLNWYQYTLKYKLNEFEFPAILLGSQNSTTEWYKITSAVSGSKSGYCIQVQMTWENVYEGIISIPDADSTVNIVTANNSYVEVTFTDILTEVPTKNEFSLTINDIVTAITGVSYDTFETIRIHFPVITTAGTYEAKLVYKSVAYADSFQVAVNE